MTRTVCDWTIFSAIFLSINFEIVSTEFVNVWICTYHVCRNKDGSIQFPEFIEMARKFPLTMFPLFKMQVCKCDFDVVCICTHTVTRTPYFMYYKYSTVLCTHYVTILCYTP